MAHWRRRKSSGVSYDPSLRGILAGARRFQVNDVSFPRLLALIPLLVYLVGVMTLLVGWSMGDLHLVFHPDRLFPFEVVGLTACAVVCWRG